MFLLLDFLCELEEERSLRKTSQTMLPQFGPSSFLKLSLKKTSKIQNNICSAGAAPVPLIWQLREFFVVDNLILVDKI